MMQKLRDRTRSGPPDALDTLLERIQNTEDYNGLQTISQAVLNPDFALGRGIRRMMPDFSVLKKLGRCPKSPSPFFVGKVSAVGSASFVSVLTPNAKSGFKAASYAKMVAKKSKVFQRLKT